MISINKALKKDVDKKIPDTNHLVAKTAFNINVTKLENKLLQPVIQLLTLS